MAIWPRPCDKSFQQAVALFEHIATHTRANDSEPIALLELRVIDGVECCDARAENGRRSVDVNRIRQHNTIVHIGQCVLGKEAVGGEALKELFAAVTVEIVYHAALAFEAGAQDVKEADSIANAEPGVLDGRVHLLDVTGAFVAQSGSLSGFDGHDVRVT